jgi:hypothetical protein
LQKSLTPPEKLFWSTQFTQASIRLFGRPLNKEIRSVAAAELQHFEDIATLVDSKNDFAKPLLDAYAKLAQHGTADASLEKRFQETLGELKQLFETEYGEVLAVFDSYDSPLTPKQIVSSFSKALKLLARRDDAWGKWSVHLTDAASLAVNVHKRLILVGSGRAPVPVRDIRGLFAHEVLIHAQRSLNGAQYSRSLAQGLPDYLDAEEGFGVLVESALNGGVPFKVKDRYIDIALALGDYRRRALNREELYVICYVRTVLRCLSTGQEMDLALLEDTTWEHVNRIYRGSLGNRYIGVFTKDVAYYKGFVKMARYFDVARKKSRLESAVRYALKGKFDPTNSTHKQVLKNFTNQSLDTKR